MLRYRLCGEDRLRQVEGDWDGFASRNGAAALRWSRVVEKPLWAFVAGAETTMLLKSVLERVRRDSRETVIPFRCDAPETRRFMEMRVRGLEGWIEIDSVLLHEEPRAAVPLLASALPHQGAPVPVCSWCKRIRLPSDSWEEADTAIARLELFNTRTVPPITHGICPNCLARVSAELEMMAPA